MKPSYYLAIDIGASSGRHIVGWMEDGILKSEEVYRFPNRMEPVDGHLTWDIARLLDEVRKGIDIAREKFGTIRRLAIDTWAVDYVLMHEDQEILPVYAYRDNRTEEIIPEVHRIFPFSELYARTGIQFQPFNSIYQLYADKKAGRLDTATDFLMIPEYLTYKLTGVKAKEYTNATTTGLLSAETGTFDRELIAGLGLPERLFTELKQPGEVIGTYQGIEAVFCASHDTASAVEGIPMEGNELYISSGTWSLLGVKTPHPLTGPQAEQANYSNEGGVNYNRLQKNIMGMWIINNLRDELCPNLAFGEIIARASASTYPETVDVNDPVFLAPASMKEAVDSRLKQKPENIGAYFRCACKSLAEGYAAAIREAEEITGTEYRNLYIVGGGARNHLLNSFTEQASGKHVIALEIEATALGNLKIQMEK